MSRLSPQTALLLKLQRPGFTFALKRCEIVGAFFNASILLALALSIFLQSIERFINVPEVDDPFLIFIVGCVGLALNTLCIMMCHGEFNPQAELVVCIC